MTIESSPVSLPYITPELPGVGGRLKADPSAFVVEEITAYDASGEGPHLYVSLTRAGWTTRKVADALASLYHIDRHAVGFAGLKDRHARCTQTFSLPGLQPEDAARIEAELPFTVNWARCHSNKLKTGHLQGNRFTITVAGLSVDADTALARANAIAGAVGERGVPNFFGAQRFGVDGQNIPRTCGLSGRRAAREVAQPPADLGLPVASVQLLSRAPNGRRPVRPAAGWRHLQEG